MVTTKSRYSLRRKTHTPVKSPTCARRGQSRALVSFGRHKLRRLSSFTPNFASWTMRTSRSIKLTFKWIFSTSWSDCLPNLNILLQHSALLTVHQLTTNSLVYVLTLSSRSDLKKKKMSPGLSLSLLLLERLDRKI